jgi:RNA-directed DNA polymerase
MTRATASKFLGFSFWIAAGRTIRRRVAPQAIARMKQRVRELTRRSAGRSLAQMYKPLGRYPSGWKVYFRLVDTPRVFADIDGWVRYRLRAVQLKHWKRGRVIDRELVARGMPPDAARRVAANSRRWWHNSAMALNLALPNHIFKRLGVPNLPADLNPANRPVRTRMPGGVAGDVEDKPPRPMPISSGAFVAHFGVALPE